MHSSRRQFIATLASGLVVTHGGRVAAQIKPAEPTFEKWNVVSSTLPFSVGMAIEVEIYNISRTGADGVLRPFYKEIASEFRKLPVTKDGTATFGLRDKLEFRFRAVQDGSYVAAWRDPKFTLSGIPFDNLTNTPVTLPRRDGTPLFQGNIRTGMIAGGKVHVGLYWQA